MLLVFDIGNTSTSMGVFENKKLVKTWRISSDSKRSCDEYGILIKNLLNNDNFIDKISSCTIASVVPYLTDVFEAAVLKYLNISPLILSTKIKTGLQYDVKNPKEIGADRIANAIAAHTLYGKTSVVVDFGTATTFDIVTMDGVFLGGIITPGLGIQASALHSFTSKLPKVNIEPPKNVVGKDTIDNILSGLVYGHASMIDGMMERVEKELGYQFITIATGGYSKTVAECLKRPFDILSPDLTLEGLRIVSELNSNCCSD